MRSTSDRIGAMCGLVSVPLMVGGVILVASVGLHYEGPASLLSREIDENRSLLGAGVFLFALAGTLLLWFFGSLRSVLVRAEGERGSLASVAFVGGCLWAFLWILYAALATSSFELTASGYYRDPEDAKTAGPLAFNMLISPIAMLLPAVVLGATAAVALPARALPRWLGRASAVFAVLFVVASALGAAFGGPALLMIVLFPIWVMVTAIPLWRRTGTRPELRTKAF